jgi:VanZ family protein
LSSLSDAPSGAAPASPPGLLSRFHRWGVQNPKYYYIAPPSFWAVAIYLISIAPLKSVEPLSRTLSLPLADKIGHMTVYAVLAVLILRGWHREKMPPLGLHGFVWLLCMVFGIMVEIQQGLIPARSFELWDMVANGVGALLGQVIWHLMMLRWGRRTRLYPGLLRPNFKDHPSQRKTSDSI